MTDQLQQQPPGPPAPRGRSARKRTDTEITRDRNQIERWMYEGLTPVEMHALVNDQYKEVRDTVTGAVVQPSRQLTKQAFHKDLKVVHERMIEGVRANADENRGRELRRLFALEMEAWKGWKASWGEEVTSTTETYASVVELTAARRERRDPVLDRAKTVVKRKAKSGDVTWLSEMRKLSRERRDLLGLDLTKPANRPAPDEQPDMEPAEAGAILMGLMGKAAAKFDEALRQGLLPAHVPVPRALLPENFTPPAGMVVSGVGPVIDVTPEPPAPADDDREADEILAALEADAQGRPRGDDDGDAG